MDYLYDPKFIAIIVMVVGSLGSIGATTKYIILRLNRLSDSVMYKNSFSQFEKRFDDLKEFIQTVNQANIDSHKQIEQWLRRIDERCMKHLAIKEGDN